MSTRGIDWVPKARAATAWAPPTRYTSVAPARWAAVSVTGFTRPSFPGGVTITMRSTPATWAGIIFMRTEEGYAALPPGTYTPALARGVTFCPRIVPSGLASNQLFLFCFS